MTLSSNSLAQILFNCEAVASVNDFKITDPESCFVYYTNEKIEVPSEYNPLYVKITGAPKNSPLEIEFHLQKHLPEIFKTEETIEKENFRIKIIKRHALELVYLN